MQRTRRISFLEDHQTIEKMDKLAEARGLDRSGFIRQLIRKELQSEADATYRKYK